MSFTVKIRGAAPRIAIADYECPAHGRFEAQVERDADGNPPATIPCPQSASTIWEPFDPDGRGAPCGVCNRPSEYRISAPLCRVRFLEAIKGKWEKPERKEWQDISKLAEGQSLDEFRAERAAIREEERKREVVEFARRNHTPIASIKE